MFKKSAKILRVTDNGVGYISEQDSQNVTAFFFDQIKGYKGETAQELGLFNGKEVLIEYDSNRHINSVAITTE